MKAGNVEIRIWTDWCITSTTTSLNARLNDHSAAPEEMVDRDKKRASLSSNDHHEGISLAAMASSYLPLGGSTSGGGATSRTRPGTPPASTYFTTFAEDPDQEPIPTPDAQTHFAFSSTLVRRATESPLMGHFHLPPVAEGLVDRVIGIKTDTGEGLEDGRSRPPSHNEVTSSSRFAHMTIDVNISSRSLFKALICWHLFSKLFPTSVHHQPQAYTLATSQHYALITVITNSQSAHQNQHTSNLQRPSTNHL